MNEITLWQPESGDLLPPSARTAQEISEYAAQLSIRDRQQLVSAFDAQHYEMAITYLWGKTVTALKKELSAVGVGLLGEMLGRPDVDEDDDIEGILTTKDAILLAGELGIVSATDSMRLRHANELISHFSRLGSEDGDLEAIDEMEAITTLKTCVKSVLGRPRVEVAKKFVDFREALENETLTIDHPQVSMLTSSPYFFKKLTVSVLMNSAKKNSGATLEHALANINSVIPAIWQGLRDGERWQVGHAYAEAFSDGRMTAVGGIKSALLKVKGFDYVPENLRSDTFVQAAAAILKAHDGMNNFYNEAAPVGNLANLGSTIPTPALPACFSALISVVLGNRYGAAWSAVPSAKLVLSRMTKERWEYYLNNVLPADTRVLTKLSDDLPRNNWVGIVQEFHISAMNIKNKTVGGLVDATVQANGSRIVSQANKLIAEYYGKEPKFTGSF